jgi:hypothetical protein
MSLKAFHLLFITAASALAFGFGVWELRDYRSAEGHSLNLWLGLGSLATGVGLIVYGRYFLRKLKKIGYL